jgi:thiaminase
MTLTASLVGNVRPIWDRQLQHPFVQALGDGTLPRENFEFYILQDALFLDTLARTFGYAATLTPDRSEMERYGELLLGTIRDVRADGGDAHGPHHVCVHPPPALDRGHGNAT